MTVTVLRMFVRKKSPLCIKYRDYKKFDEKLFQSDLCYALQGLNLGNLVFDTFEQVFMNVLDKHAKIKHKFVRENKSPFMTRVIKSDHESI